jgi:DNA-binding IclR family transcriptional regulator
LPDLSARLDIPRQTVHRVLTQVEKAGLVLRNPARERYSIGPRLLRLGLAALSSQNQGTPVRAILRDLVDEIGETCNVGVLDGLNYVYVLRIECKWPLRTHLTAGSRMGAHCVSGGKILLAHLEPDRLKLLLRRRKLPTRTSRTLTRVGDLEIDLAKSRKRGFAISNEEFLDGIVGVAVPILDTTGHPVAALAMHGPVTRLTVKDCEARVGRLRRAAERFAKVWSSV